MDNVCRKAVRDRVLHDVLGSVVDSVGAGWKVLIMDGLTTRITSAALRMSDILDTGVSVVEDLEKVREPLPLAAVYFITPSPASVARLLADFAEKPLYPSVHVFFSNRLSADAVDRIKRCRVLLPHLKTLKEVNLEFVAIDGRTFVTEHPHALLRCMGERSEVGRGECEAELDSVASRLVTLFATLHEYPAIRYHAGKGGQAEAGSGGSRGALAQRLAVKVSERAMVLQSGGGLPSRETCDLLVFDRSVDPLAPVIHDWTYEAMVYDLLPLEDNVIRYTAETAAGKQEAREHILDESTDDLWAEYRHSHIADVYTALSKRLSEFQGKNEAVKHQKGIGAGVAGASTSSVKALIQALPQYREVLGRLAVHIYISSELMKATQARNLQELGELEQNLVCGDSSSNDLAKFLTDKGGQVGTVDRMRLLMSFLSSHPEKLDGSKRAQWQKLARLEDPDMATVSNLALLNAAAMQQQQQRSQGKASGFSWAPRKKKAGAYRKREGGQAAEQQYTLGRVDPVLQELMMDCLANKLPQEEYPFVRPPEEGDDFDSNEALRIASARTNRSATSWARKGSGVDAASGAAAPGSITTMQGRSLGLAQGAAGGSLCLCLGRDTQ